MKAAIVFVIALVIGAVVGLAVMSIRYNQPDSQILVYAWMPFSIAVLASFVLSLMVARWWLVACAIGLPAVLLSLIMALGLSAEGRWDWGWPIVSAVAVLAAGVPSWLAHQLSHRP